MFLFNRHAVERYNLLSVCVCVFQDVDEINPNQIVLHQKYIIYTHRHTISHKYEGITTVATDVGKKTRRRSSSRQLGSHY